MAGGPEIAYRRAIAEGRVKGDPHQARAVQVLQRLHEQLAGYHPGERGFFGLGPVRAAPKGVYLHGPVGRGKSMLMDLFFDGAPVAPKRRVHFHAFMQETQAALHEWRNLSPAERRSRPNFVAEAEDDPVPPIAQAILASATLLCFDEFQVTDIADAMILGRLFEALLARGAVIVCTSNRAPPELYENGINRQLFLPFIDLISERMEIVPLDGPIDYRLGRLAGSRVYFTPLDAAAEAGMSAQWRDLTGMAKGEPGRLTVLGRVLTIPQQAKGVARFAFAELCDAPLAPADHLAICAAFHAVLVDRIPQMGEDLRDAARRFVVFVDAAYEAHVKLVCSAATPPTGLFQMRTGAVEYGRCVSRLQEMQSADYLSRPHAPRGR
jgi:cell division protein ZapE